MKPKTKSDPGEASPIKPTAEHPFYVPVQGKFVPAGELKAGDELVSHSGQLVRIEAVSQLGEIVTVYNLWVANHHTYFVGGAEGNWDVWVHNAYNAQRSEATRIDYADSDMAAEALNYRRARAGMILRDGRRLDKGNGNVAVFEYLDDNNQLVKRAFLNRMHDDHAELWGMRVLHRAGIARDRIRRVYSELEYCPGCASLTKASFPNATRSYSFPYNIQRSLGRHLKSEAVQRALGV